MTFHRYVWALLAIIALQRVAELALTRRNLSRLLDRGGRLIRRDGFRPLLAVHVLFFAALVYETTFAPWTRITRFWAVPFGLGLAAVTLRYWAAAVLGDRYTVRVVDLPHLPLVDSGPYKVLRHPIYVAVWVELVVWPLIFGAYLTSAAMAFINWMALLNRVRVERQVLARAPPRAPTPPPGGATRGPPRATR